MGAPDLREILKTTPFGDLPSEALDRLARLLELRRVPAGTVLCREGETEGRFCILAEGLLKAYRILPTGKSVTVFLLKAPDSFGFLPLLDGGPLPLYVEAVEPSVVYILRRGPFWDLLREVPAFALPLLAHLAEKFRDCIGKLDTLARPGALPRLAQALCSLAEPGVPRAGDTATVTLPVSQEALAHTLGIAPENLSRALARLIREGIVVRTGRRRFHIPSLQRLRALADAR
ncbi:MAG: Crp/Fnr family transcriptional regulator [Acidobacteriota bacterium]